MQFQIVLSFSCQKKYGTIAQIYYDEFMQKAENKLQSFNNQLFSIDLPLFLTPL